MKIFPNPFTNKIYISIQSEFNDHTSFIVHDVLGRTLLVQHEKILMGENKYEIKFDGRFSGGIYFIEIITSERNFKLVKPLLKE